MLRAETKTVCRLMGNPLSYFVNLSNVDVFSRGTPGHTRIVRFPKLFRNEVRREKKYDWCYDLAMLRRTLCIYLFCLHCIAMGTSYHMSCALTAGLLEYSQVFIIVTQKLIYLLLSGKEHKTFFARNYKCSNRL